MNAMTRLIDYKGCARQHRDRAARYYRRARRLERVLAPQYEDLAAEAAELADRNDEGQAERWAEVADANLALAAQARELAPVLRRFAREENARARWFAQHDPQDPS
jgi:hypothetical protein